ncbi:F-box/LRR-repeat protein 13 [Linum perenne]
MASESTKRRKPNAETKDLISELPDEILHSILLRLRSIHAARTITISTRWRSLWRSYPVAEFHDFQQSNNGSNFQKFAKATIEKFTRDSHLRMRVLNLSVSMNRDTFVLHPPLVEQLFDLALLRKAEEVTILNSYYELPFRLASSSSLKILRLSGIRLMYGNVQLLSFNSLRSLLILNVELECASLLEILIASSPLLETLELGSIRNFSKLELSNVANLWKLVISDCNKLEEIEIAAPRLQTLHLTTSTQNAVLNKIGITAPELHHLKMQGKFLRLKLSDVAAVISELRSLRTLILGGTFSSLETTLRLSVPKLEELTLINLCRFKEIDVDGGPDLTEFSLQYDRFCSDQLRVCRINHANADCRWELRIGIGTSERCLDRGFDYMMSESVKLKKFLLRFPQFSTVNIHSCHFYLIDAGANEARCPTAIEHLIIDGDTYSSSLDIQYTILDGLFLACRPKYMSFNGYLKTSLEEFCLRYSSMMKNDEQGVKGRYNWQRQLKDVKIATEEEKEKDLANVSKDMIALLKNPGRVCLRLTWS